MQRATGRQLRCPDSGRVLKVSKKVLKTFARYEQKEACLEAGGILLGNVSKDYVEIIDATTPNRLDLRSILSFIRARTPAQSRVNEAWKRSNGTAVYLGEWHTHPEVNPVPSSRDKQMIFEAFKETDMEIDFLYLVIVGLSQTYWVGKQANKGLIRISNWEIF